MSCFGLLALLLLASFCVYLLRDTASPALSQGTRAPVSDVATAQVSLVDVQKQSLAVTVIDPGSLTDLQAVLSWHSKATRYSEIESIRASGIYTSVGGAVKIRSLAKKPHFYRQTVIDGSFQIDVGFDGLDYWHSESQPLFDASDESLVALNYVLFILESAVPYLVWEFDQGVQARKHFQLMENVVWNGHACYVIQNSGLLESPVYHYIDASTGLELCRRVSFAAGRRDEKEVELRYLPALPGSKYALPGGAEVYLDGALYGSTTLETVEVNQGLMDFLFRPR